MKLEPELVRVIMESLEQQLLLAMSEDTTVDVPRIAGEIDVRSRKGNFIKVTIEFKEVSHA